MGATDSEIKTAYRRLARISHPDVKDSSGEEFMKIHASSSGRCCEEESYSLSADISESESSSGFFGCRYNDGASSSSLKSSSFAASHSVSGNDSMFPMPPFSFPLIGECDDAMIWDKKQPQIQSDTDFSEIDMMKEKFAKLLLGEDMSGGGISRTFGTICVILCMNLGLFLLVAH